MATRYTELTRLPEDDEVVDEPQHAKEEPEPWGVRKNWQQLSVALLLTFNIGAVLSVHKVMPMSTTLCAPALTSGYKRPEPLPRPIRWR